MADPDDHRDRSKSLRAAVSTALVAVALGGIWTVTRPDAAELPPTVAPTTSQPPDRAAPPGTVATPSTTLAPFTAAFSPFAATDLVSRTNPVPDLPAVENVAAEIYVDPTDGDDANSGAIDAPVASLEAAQRLARPALREAGGDVVVYLAGGTHFRNETFTLGFQDSGRDGNRMIYRSNPGEQAVIEGGVQVSDWTPAFGSVVVAAVPDSVSDVRQFYAAGGRQQRARAATADATAIEFARDRVLGAQRDSALVVASDLVSDFAHPEDLELVYIGVAVSGHGVERNSGNEILRPSWKAHRLPVEAAIELGDGLTRLDISNGALHHASERGYAPLELLPSDPFIFENALELLDEPGEWYFDPRERLIFWWPPSADATADAWLPVTEVLLAIDGTLARPVRNVSIEGIAFRHSAYTRPNEEGYVVSQAAVWFTSWKQPHWMSEGPVAHSFLDRGRPPGIPGAAVEIDSARDIAFTGNVFTELGALGVLLSNDVVRASFDRNLFVDISAEALVAGHPEHDEIDEPTEGPIADITFTNNIVDRAGAEFYASVGVQLTKVDGATVAHNLFHDLPYSGLSLGWGWANNPNSFVHRAITVENNYFENVVHTLYDGAPIYLLGPVAEPGAPRRDHTHIRGNFANNVGAGIQFKAPSDTVDPDFAKRPGLQLDKGVRNTVIADNVFTGSSAWLQVTAWQERRDDPRWREELALSGAGNWSDVGRSVPVNTTLAGVAAVKLFDVNDVPDEVRELIGGAGLEPGVALPPLPR